MKSLSIFCDSRLGENPGFAREAKAVSIANFD